MSEIDFTSHTEFLAKLREAGYNDDIIHLDFQATPDEVGFEGQLTVTARYDEKRSFWVATPIPRLSPPYEYLYAVTKAFLDEVRMKYQEVVEEPKSNELSW